MNMPLAIWRAHLTSSHNAVRHDARLQIALVFALIFSLVLGFWSNSQLLTRLQHWQAQGSDALALGLWSLCWITWSGMGGFAVLGVRRTLSSDETLLLFTLSLNPATRFRALFGSFFLANLGALGLLQAVVLGYVLISTLGWQALSWFVLLQLGVPVAALCALIASLLVARYLLPRGQIKTRIWTAIVGGLFLLLAGFYGLKLVTTMPVLLFWLRPELVSLLFILVLVLALWPCAARFGRLYTATFHSMQSGDRDRKTFSLPGMHGLKRLFERRRSLTGALFARALLNQSRNWISWLRIVVSWGLLALFPLLRSAISQYSIADTVLVTGYAAALAIVHIIETGPSAFSGEANRLTLYLTAPFTRAHILRAKLIVFLLPVLLEGLLMGLLLCWWQGLSISQVGFVVVTIALLITGCTILLVLGSAWDADLNLAVEGAAERLMQEEGPFSPRRMLLFNTCIFSFAAMLLLLWKIPAMLALPTLILLNVGIVTGMWRLSNASLKRLIQRG